MRDPGFYGAGRAVARRALEEDLAGYGDVTTELAVPAQAQVSAAVVAREELVLSGLPAAALVLGEVDPAVRFIPRAGEGDLVRAGETVAECYGPARSILTAERTLLNLLRHLSGIATRARLYAEEVRDLPVRVVDTRKTTPGLRYWEKRAIRHGGCSNHRFGLFDMVLLKDNHVAVAGGVAEAVRRARRTAPFGMKIEVEVEEEASLREALEAGADIVMLDNMAPGDMRRAVELARSRRPDVLLEASGKVTLDTVRSVAETGVDVVSAGDLIGGARPVDLALDVTHVSEGGPPDGDAGGAPRESRGA